MGIRRVEMGQFYAFVKSFFMYVCGVSEITGELQKCFLNF
jgi:hypothetical protein